MTIQLTLPDHLTEKYQSPRGFRHAKRAETRVTIDFVKQLRTDAAYTPAHREIMQLETLLETISQKLSRKTWGT